jgi:hypothetical protein
MICSFWEIEHINKGKIVKLQRKLTHCAVSREENKTKYIRQAYMKAKLELNGGKHKWMGLEQNIGLEHI